MKVEWVPVGLYVGILIVLATGGFKVLAIALPIGAFLWILENISS